ncbi:glycerate kinase [Anthocerotibacter panamensis]|uniref:glycerate kinase n=1 Tax=Anthocerotibacter panamensis TaxID=2857077 RepID=UPI001C401C02|nr:glycerate kinase [Anthocerotibacter panamensis]
MVSTNVIYTCHGNPDLIHTVRVLVCPEPFQGGISAHRAAGVIADGLSSTSNHFQIRQIPLSFDDLTVNTIVQACGGVWREAVVLGEQGKSLRVSYGSLQGGRVAVVQPQHLATRVSPSNWAGEMSSFGTGQLLKVILQDRTVERVYCYLPEGLWPVDGGVGFLQALGVSLLDPDGKSVSWAANSLSRLTRVDFRGVLPRLKQVELIVACDSQAPLLGRQGAAWTWGSRSGASFAMIEKVEKGLTILAEAVQRTYGGGHHVLGGAASGGGLGYGLSLVGAKLRPPAQVLLENLDFLEQVRQSDLVITGQAQTNRQTTPQQLLPSVLRLCQETGTPGVVLSGIVRPQELETVFNSGAWAVLDVVPGMLTTTQMLEQIENNLYFNAQQLGRLLLLGRKLSPS